MITIGITTYNRKKILEKMAQSFYESDRPYPYNIRIYDDNSTEYDAEYLRALFPDAVTIYTHEQNYGADANMRFMYEDFLKYEDELFFNADSDLIFKKDWMRVLIDELAHTDGVLSGFRSNIHKELETNVSDFSLISKEDLGAAGTLFTKKNIKTILECVDSSSESFDWKWSACLKKKGIRLMSVKDSVIQHIGIWGQNTANGYFDYGQNFFVDSLNNGQVLNDILFELSNLNSSRRSSYYIFPFDKIPQGSKIILYGCGKCGKDFINQIEKTQYCSIVALCDNAYKKMKNVYSPEIIKTLNYDYVVVSITREDIADSVIKQLIKEGIKKNQIIRVSVQNRIMLY